MSKVVEVMYGDRDVDKALRCWRCEGTGEVEEFGKVIVCPPCEGTKIDRHPQVYAYVVDDDVKVGDHVIVPPSWVPGSTAQLATVVREGSSYAGPLKHARRADREAAA